MKLGISSEGKALNSQIDPRFGRCAYFMIVQTDDNTFEVFENEFKSLGGGAGIQAAGFLQSKDVETVLTGNCGPNAMKVFSEANIPVVTGQTGMIKDSIAQFKNGSLTPSVHPTVDEKAGMAAPSGRGNTGTQGQGRCRGGSGRGMGRGQGTGRGRGRGMGQGQGQGSGRGMGRQ